MNEKNIRLVTAESVRAGHPDKFCDQIADAILDAHLAHDPAARVAVEVFATEGKMIIGGEITSKAEVDCGEIVAETINRIGYNMRDLSDDPCNCELRSSLSKHFLRTRDFLDISQMEFASELNIDRRSYIDIEHSENLCCTMTLLIYLCYYCKDPTALLSDCKDIFDKYLPPPKYLP